MEAAEKGISVPILWMQKLSPREGKGQGLSGFRLLTLAGELSPQSAV